MGNKAMKHMDELHNTDIEPLRFAAIAFGLSVLVLISYELFGHKLVKSMYDGKSIGILNSLIRYQYKKPVGHYLDLADSLFYNPWLLIGVVMPAWVTLNKLLGRRRIAVASESETSRSGDKSSSHEISSKQIVIVLLVSLGVRALFLPWLTDLSTAGDATYYWSVPKLLASGDFAKAVMRPPLWGYMLAIPTMLYDHVISGRILSVLIGSSSAVLLYLLGVRVFNRRTGIVAGLMYAFFPTHIGYSQCLWAENLFGLLTILATLFLFLFLENTKKNKYFLLCFVTASFALLTKEFAVILFAGLIIVLFFSKVERKIRRIFVACILFLLPAIIYSTAVSLVTDRVIILNDAILLNFTRASGVDPDYEYSFETREDAAAKLLSFLKDRDLGRTLSNAGHQFYRLWTPQSFIITRMFGVFLPETWSYGINNPMPWVAVVVSYYVFVILTGLAGLCFAEPGKFKAFSVTCLVTLSMTGILALLVSRYRLAFMFIFVLYSAHILTNPKFLLGRDKILSKVLFFLLLSRLFVDIVVSKSGVLSRWG